MSRKAHAEPLTGYDQPVTGAAPPPPDPRDAWRLRDRLRRSALSELRTLDEMLEHDRKLEHVERAAEIAEEVLRTLDRLRQAHESTALSRDQVSLDLRRALRECFPDRAEVLLSHVAYLGPVVSFGDVGADEPGLSREVRRDSAT